MSEDTAYRDALAAAHARIAELEARVTSQRRIDAAAARLAALQVERARVLTVAPPDSLKKQLGLSLFIPASLIALVLTYDHAWHLAVGAIGIACTIWAVATSVARSNHDAARRQLELVDREIARLEKTAHAALTADASPGLEPPRPVTDGDVR